MPSFSLFRRKPLDSYDPWWEMDGPAARRERRRQRIMSFVAFVASVWAFGGAAFVWAIHLGVASALGVHMRLAFG